MEKKDKLVIKKSYLGCFISKLTQNMSVSRVSAFNNDLLIVRMCFSAIMLYKSLFTGFNDVFYSDVQPLNSERLFNVP